MKDQAGMLLRIQVLDVEIARLEKQLSDMPEKRAILAARKRIKDIEALEQRTNVFIGDLERVVSRDEDEVSSIAAKMESEQAKLLSGKITNPKEVQHISNELDMLRRQKEKAEDAILTQMEKRERALEQRAKVDAAKAEAQATEVDLVEGFKGKGSTLQHEIDESVRERKQLIAELEANNRERYLTARSSRQGVIIGVLKDGTCGACRMELPADIAHELLSGEPIAECPLCHRILIVRVDEEQDA